MRLDEFSIESPSHVAELRDGDITVYTITPGQVGLERGKVSELAVQSADESLSMIKRVFDNEAGSARDIVALNAGAAIYAAGLASSLQAGVDKALACIASGGARDRLQALAQLSQKLAS